MAKKGKKLNTDLDESLIPSEPIDDVVPEEGAPEEDLMSYTMGKIEAEDSEDDEAEEFKKAAKSVISGGGEEDEDEWVEEVEYNDQDEDSFLDEANYDPDDLDQYGDN